MAYPYPGPRRPSAVPALGRLLMLLGGSLVVAAAVAWLFGWRFGPIGPANDPDAQPRAIVARGNLAEDEQSTVALFKRVSPCVVHITTLQRDRFSLSLDAIPRGTGTGFIWDKQGYIVTNFHVLQGADAARVTLNDQTQLPARLTGGAPDYDLAVLKIDPLGKDLPAIDLGTSNDLLVGQKVFAIGNPFGLDQSLTTGVISALGRQIKSLTEQQIDNVIQTDAAINPGNSGGPLLDSAGRLIGVNTQIVSPSGAFAGIGFAIPVDTVNQVVPELIRRGRVPKASLGVELASDAQAARVRARFGVLVLQVPEDSAAAAAGLRSLRQTREGLIGDVIVAIDGQPVRSRADLTRLLAKRQVGEKVTLTVRRETGDVEVEVVLQEA